MVTFSAGRFYQNANNRVPKSFFSTIPIIPMSFVVNPLRSCSKPGVDRRCANDLAACGNSVLGALQGLRRGALDRPRKEAYEKAILSEIDSGRSVRVHASFAARSGIAEDEDHARTGLCAHQPAPTVQSGRYGGDHRDRRGNHRYWRRRLSRFTETVCRAADRAGPAAYRTAVAGHVAVVLLSSWARKRTCARRARSCAVGHQRQGAETAGSRNPGWHGAELLRVLQ